jgi:YggT family protein
VLRRIACDLLFVYLLIMLARVLSSWFPPPTGGPMRTVMGWVYDLTEPLMRPVRSLLPPVRMGAMAMDFSPILIFIVIAILQRSIC